MSRSNLYFLPSGTVDEFNVVVEIPKGSHNKYELNPETQALELDRVLYGAAFYPADYGFIPSTKAEDGDAVDVLILSTNPIPPLTVVPCRAVGMFDMIDGGERDFKIIAVPTVDPRFNDYKDIDDVPAHVIKDMKDFFTNMQKFKKGQWITTNEVGGTFGREKANEEIAAHLNNFTNNN